MKRKWLIALAALLALAGLVLWLVPSREPVHKGKPISYWVNQACRTFPANEQYVREIAAIGPPAVPYLVARLEAQDKPATSLRRAWESVRRRLPQWAQNLLPGPGTAFDGWVTASECFRRLGSRGELAVPELIRLLRWPGIDSDQYDRVADALAGIGPKARVALPVLRSQLKGRPLREQTYLAGVMWTIGEDAGFVCGICSNALTHKPDDNAAMNAVGLAAEMGPEARPLALVLARSATNVAFSRTTHRWAFEAIGRLGLTNETVIQALLTGTMHPYSYIRARSAADLWRIDPHYAALAVPVLVNSVTDRQTALPVAAERREVLDSCLQKLDVTMALPALAEISTNGTSEARQIATKALRQLEARAAGEAAKP